MYQKIYTITVPVEVPASVAERPRRRRRRDPIDAIYRTAAMAVVLIAACFILAAIVHERAKLAERELVPSLPAVVISEEDQEQQETEEPKVQLITLAAIPPPAVAEPVDLYDPEIPVSREIQEYMRTYCEKYGVPYAMVLAVAEIESHFDMDAIGAVGEVGMMQLNPGPGGTYHAEIRAATGIDPTTPEGNVAGACWMLSKYLAEYKEPNLAAMCYNMGRGGANGAWSSGCYSTEYSRAVVAAMAVWDIVLEG